MDLWLRVIHRELYTVVHISLFRVLMNLEISSSSFYTLVNVLTEQMGHNVLISKH